MNLINLKMDEIVPNLPNWEAFTRKIRTVIGEVVPFSDVPQAFEDMATSKTTWRITVQV